MTIHAAADGSALGNPGPTGWSWYVDDEHWAAGGRAHGTNNIGELSALLELLRATAQRPGERLHVLCDSQYVINSVTKWMPGWKRKGWKKSDGKPVLNRELLEQLDAAMRGRDVELEWVKGHAGHPLNEAADVRARAAATAFSSGREPDAGPGFDEHDEAEQQTGTASGGDEPSSKAAGSPVRARFAGPVENGLESATIGQGVDAGTPEVAATGASRKSGSRHSALIADPYEEPDLFSLFAEDDDGSENVSPEPTTAESEAVAASEVLAQERELLHADVRADPDRLDALLHPNFQEIGASGRLLERPEILQTLEPADADLEVVSADIVAAGVVLLLWRAAGDSGSSLRSSLWMRDLTGLEPGPWRLRFQQGTREP